MAYLGSLITNLAVSIHGKKGSKPTNVLDFMPKWDNIEEKGKPVKNQSIEDMKKAMFEIAEAQNKKVKGKKKPPDKLKE